MKLKCLRYDVTLLQGSNMPRNYYDLYMYKEVVKRNERVFFFEV